MPSSNANVARAGAPTRGARTFNTGVGFLLRHSTSLVAIDSEKEHDWWCKSSKVISAKFARTRGLSRSEIGEPLECWGSNKIHSLHRAFSGCHITAQSMEDKLNAYVGYLSFGHSQRYTAQVFDYLRAEGLALHRHPNASWRLLEQSYRQHEGLQPQQEQSEEQQQ